MAGLAHAAGATPAPSSNASVVSPFKSPFRSGRVVVIRYTRFVRHRRYEQQNLFGPELLRAVCEIADQLDRHPGELTAVDHELGEIAIQARMRPTVADDLEPGTVQTLAYVKGITAAEFGLGLLEIQKPSWAMVTR